MDVGYEFKQTITYIQFQHRYFSISVVCWIAVAYYIPMQGGFTAYYCLADNPIVLDISRVSHLHDGVPLSESSRCI
jgi:hypothetical protein